MKALVTGDAGFVGSHFSRRLKDQGWDVIGLDIVNGADCRHAFADPDFTARFDLVVHCAALVGGRRMIEGGPLLVAQDLGIDAAMFEWAARTRQLRVLYPSSSAAYPMRLQRRGMTWRLSERMIDLTCVEEPDASYGLVKITGERLAGWARDRGVRVHTVRPFSGYGIGQSLDYPFPSYIKRAVDQVAQFEVWGDGTQVRDFIHISDVVEACMRIIDAGYEDPVNLGTGRAVSFNELAALVMRASGHVVPIVHRPAEPVGSWYRVADTARLSEFYEPQVSLEEGIRWALA